MSKIYRIAPPSALIFRDDDGEQTVEGVVVPYNQWSEVDSVIEGHFMERFAPGSLRKSFSEGFARMKGYFEHGRSRLFDRTPIMELREAWETNEAAFFRANLLRGLPPWMIDGLRRGVYGVSLGAEEVKTDSVRYPKRSAHNPKGIEERTYKELRGYDISLTPSPHYAEATAMLRSITDDLTVKELLKDPDALVELLRRATETEAEPTHSEPTDEVQEAPEPATEPAEVEETEPEEKPDDPEPEPEPEPEGSRATQPPTDYLSDEQEEEWRL
jgi:phage head maturation protease